MKKFPKPWFRPGRGVWYVTIHGKQHNLGPDEAEAHRLYHELMAKPPEPPAPPADGLTVAELLEKYLAWCHQHRAPRTYSDHRHLIQLFLDESPGLAAMPAASLRPYHVIEWLDKHSWGSTRRRLGIVAVQRPYNWAEELGYIGASPIRRVKKPLSGRREQAVTPEQWHQIRDHYPEADPFRDLLEVCWESGCRPTEARLIEARHVHLERLCVLFPPDEAKGKKRWRVIRLTQKAAEITDRRLAGRSEGYVFLNAAGRPWTPYAMNCRFCRLKKHVGVKHFAYAWRHGFATRKLIEGHDHLSVAELLGHSDGTTLSKVYAHLDQADDYLRRVLTDEGDKT